jgi:HD-GYP domain-containing protein (c-di-GMP phosphodiesterase class II)
LKEHLLSFSFSDKITELIMDATKYHHERFDGKGYPYNLKGKDIPLISRIMCVADSFDAIYAKRPYNEGLSLKESLSEIERNMGTQFDPEIAKIFISKMEQRVQVLTK